MLVGADTPGAHAWGWQLQHAAVHSMCTLPHQCQDSALADACKAWCTSMLHVSTWLRCNLQRAVALTPLPPPAVAPTYLQVQANPYVQHAVQLERWLMEGAYNKVLEAGHSLPKEFHGFYLEQLNATVR